MSDDARLFDLVASSREGILATIKRDGRPQLSNILYVWDAEQRVARISTTATRAKARNLRRDPRASLYVAGGHFWSFAVAEGEATLIGPSVEAGDEAGRELLEVHSAFYGALDENEFFAEMVEHQRLVVRVAVARVYGLAMDDPPS
jgi:PPOX class probable F420-dependent enzyme